jgi:hypothetical protein
MQAGGLYQKACDVGDRFRVQLINTNVERGYINFEKINLSNLRKGDLYEKRNRFVD